MKTVLVDHYLWKYASTHALLKWAHFHSMNNNNFLLKSDFAKNQLTYCQVIALVNSLGK